MCLEVKQLKDALEKEKSSTSARQVVTSVNSNEELASRGLVNLRHLPAEGRNYFPKLLDAKTKSATG